MVRVFDLQIGALSDIFSPLLDSHSACCRNNSQQAKYEHDKNKFVLEKLISSFFHVYHLGISLATFYLLLLRNFHDLNPLKIIFQQFPELTPLLSLHRIRPSLGESVSAADPLR